MSHARNVRGAKAGLGMQGPADRKARGRTAHTVEKEVAGGTGQERVTQAIGREASRPQGPGTGKHRGDRRDTSRLYTNNSKHKARGNTPRADVKTRKR